MFPIFFGAEMTLDRNGPNGKKIMNINVLPPKQGKCENKSYSQIFPSRVQTASKT